MNAYTMGVLAAVGGIGALVAGSMLDRGMNYTQTDAVVTSAKVDCFVKSGKRYLVETATDKMAYMDCKMAPLAASMHGFKESDVKKRTKLKFRYKSVVDGSSQTGEHTAEYTTYKVGQKIKIYSHKTEPKKMRFS